MRVLEVIGSLNRGGAETLLVNIFENINKDNSEFDFLVYENKEFDYSKKIKELGGNIIYIESPTSIGMFNFINKLRKLIEKNKYDIVHAHTLFNCGPVMLSAFLAGVKKRLSHSHNTKILDEKISIKKRIYFFISKILINIFSSKCLACGKSAGNFLFYKFRRFTIIKNGINLDKYKYNEKINKKLRIKYNISENSIIIGNIGRLNHQKNQNFLIDIFYEFHKNNKNSYLFIVGEGELRRELTNKVNNLKLKNNVIFTGNVSNANEYYSMFNLFLFPSIFEGLPYTLIEAQENGLPILSSDKVSNEVNITKKIEFLSLNKSAKKWADECVKLLKNQRKNNDKYIIENGYSIKNTTNLIEDIYKL